MAGDTSGKLTYELKNSTPVELMDFTNAMFGLADEYRRFSAHRAEGKEEAKLFIKEVRGGSIITELIAAVPMGMAAAAPVLENANAIYDFTKNLVEALQALLSRSRTAPREVTKQSLQNHIRIVEPVAKDSAAQLNLSTGVINNYGTIELHISSADANAIQNNARRQIEQMNEPIAGVHNNKVMHWHQARNDAASSGDKGIIESLSLLPVKVLFLDPDVKRAALEAPDNPFKKPLLVDVEVDTINNRPKLYKILRVIEKIDDETDET